MCIKHLTVGFMSLSHYLQMPCKLNVVCNFGDVPKLTTIEQQGTFKKTFFFVTLLLSVNVGHTLLKCTLT